MRKSSGITARIELRAAERATYVIALSILSINLFMIAWKSPAIDWKAYSIILMMPVMLFPAGLYYRLSGRSERIASALICTGGLILFTTTASVFNYLILPISGTPIDLQLAQIDAMLGFHWPTAMEWAANHPNVSWVLNLCYNSTIPQLSVLVVLLGLLGRHTDLHTMLLTLVISSIATISFWSFIPSFGTTTIYELPQEVWAGVSAFVDQTYADELKAAALNGPAMIGPAEIRGLIALPSYHSVMAFVAIAASRNIRYVFPLFLVINLLILPGTIIHGGHHLVDLIGGFVVFAMAFVIARRIVLNERVRFELPVIASS